MKVLVINCGSSTLKYQVVDTVSGRSVVKETIEYGSAGSAAVQPALKKVLDGVRETGALGAVGHRVVHGGDRFHAPVTIDESVLSAIEACIPLAPLHNPANLAGIRAARDLLPSLPHVAVFDTAFHVRMPRRARTYAIEQAVAEQYGIRRFGFHGTSHAYVAGLAARHLDRPLNELRIITLHLGNGASACAVEFGGSVETSMGLTPLEGLVMGTRSGDIDAGAVLKLARELGIDETDKLLNEASGLSGLSGAGHDLRNIETKAASGDDRARLAITVFAHRCRKYIGAYAAIMGGLDAIVLTGGIGENSASMRQRILQRLEFLGVVMDEDRNVAARVSHEAPVADLGAEHSRVRVLAVATNEELEIARETERLVGQQKLPASESPIGIAVSARHVHLNREAMDVLFGAGSELTPEKEISQPGQYAAIERVSLVGPRGRLDRVRVIGPLRPQAQVEISRTDEFALGVDAPVRASGHTEGSAPITLEGPKGKLHLREGLICAWRHIHMTPKDADDLGVEDGAMVEVAVTGGPRDLIFGDVLVRVKDDYKLEMHIDTDEANAAELSPGGQGELVSHDVYTVPSSAARALVRSRR